MFTAQQSVKKAHCAFLQTQTLKIDENGTKLLRSYLNASSKALELQSELAGDDRPNVANLTPPIYVLIVT